MNTCSKKFDCDVTSEKELLEVERELEEVKREFAAQSKVRMIECLFRSYKYKVVENV